MPVQCQGLITGKLHNSRWTAGRDGYTGAPAPKAIVLHQLVGTDVGYYQAQMQAILPRFLCTPDLLTCDYPVTANPKAVHFTVTPTGYTQYAELSDTVLGIDYINGTWPGITNLAPITDVNGPFIHIAIDSNCEGQLLTLLCCIAIDLGIVLPIISAGDVQADRLSFAIDPSIETQTEFCFASGGWVQPPDIFTLADRVTVLETCCATNTASILSLTNAVGLLQGRVSNLEGRVTSVESGIADIYDKVAVIPNLVAQVTQLINQVTDILTRCCPTATDAACAQYQLQAGDEMLITPNQPVWLNLPTKIEDTTPPIVQPGPLWMASLLNCTWAIEASIRFRLAQWCVGKKASLYIVACGKKYLLAEQVISSTASQAVTLTGTFILPPGCTDVHLLVATNDDKITSAKVVEFASWKSCCV